MTANSLMSWSRFCRDKKHPPSILGPGHSSSLGPSTSCPYSAKCLEDVFSKVRLGHEQDGVVATSTSSAGSSRSRFSS